MIFRSSSSSLDPSPFATASAVNPHLVEEHGLSEPDIFIEDPGNYLDRVERVQERVFEMGKFALEGLQNEGNVSVLQLLPSPPPGSGELQANHLRSLVARGAQLASAILQAHKILLPAKCGGFNIIVVDSSRANVLRVVPIVLEQVFILSSLLDEALATCGYFIDWSALESISVDVHRVAELILQALGFYAGMSCTPQETLWENLLQTYNTVSATLLVLFLGMVSFVTSHSGREHTLGKEGLEYLRIETGACPIYMAPRRLKCLHSFTTSSGLLTLASRRHYRGSQLTSLFTYLCTWQTFHACGVQ